MTLRKPEENREVNRGSGRWSVVGVSGQWSEVRGQRSEVRGQKSEVRGPRGQRSAIEGSLISDV